MAGRRLTIGSRLTRSLTVLGIVDDGGKDKVYLVWNHDAWCAMACKVYRDFHRARREAAILQHIQHPNVVRSFGVVDGPRPLVLMEFLQGPTLRHILRTSPRHRLPISDALRAAVHIASALHHIHARGYLHLDVKPANIIVVNGRPVLFDVGTAVRGWRTRLPEVIGTDDYLSPEQCRVGIATAATDVFALGVVVYEMLAGTLPFPRAHRRNPLPPLRCTPRPLIAQRRGLPSGLSDLVMACLDDDPRSRPTLAALMQGLDCHIRSGPRMLPAAVARGHRR